MAYDTSNKLVIGIASSALFDLSESDQIFRDQGQERYRQYQHRNEHKPLKQGVAFAFIKRLLSLNQIRQSEPSLVEVILLSRNDPDTGLRVMNSIAHYGLNITRACFVQGRSPHRYINAFDISLFLSANEEDVHNTISHGQAAGLILQSQTLHDEDGDLPELRIGFDFDGVLANHESESVYQTQGEAEFHKNESRKALLPIGDGPLKEFFLKLGKIQKIEQKLLQQNPTYQARLRIVIVTARNAPSHERVIHTLRYWGINVNEAFFLGGIQKKKVLDVLRPHIFFDDYLNHLIPVSDYLPAVHVPMKVCQAELDTSTKHTDTAKPKRTTPSNRVAKASTSSRSPLAKGTKKPPLKGRLK